MPTREFRGVWVATVSNLDWPVQGASAESQKNHLRQIFDKVKEANLNAVFFQVRTEGDAFYRSRQEPWSRYLTGYMGKDPGYDPLAFAIEEAHARGLELHAWFNPFRVNAASFPDKKYAPTHITVLKPEWVLSFANGKRILNPGIPAVREYVAGVIQEVAANYAVDGVHFDDYFYPYAEGPFLGISREDAQTFAQFGKGFPTVKDWRRFNVTETIRLVQERLQATRPAARFGISPFGLWKNGTPVGTTGMDAYNVIGADALAWLEKGYVDYLTPQLYWPIGGKQDYQKLLEWWADQTSAHGRHLYAGHYPGRLGFTRQELPNQIKINRENRNRNSMGSVLFRVSDVIQADGTLFPTLKDSAFRLPALPPALPWKKGQSPAAPAFLSFSKNDSTHSYTLSWQRSEENREAFKRYAVYQLGEYPEPMAALPDGSLLAVTTGEALEVPAPQFEQGGPYWLVTEVGPSNLESSWSNLISRLETAEAPVVAVAPQPLPDPVPVLVEPLQREVFTASPAFQFKWEATQPAEAFHFQWSRDPEFLVLLEEQTEVPDSVTARSFANLSAGASYYFRVRSKQGNAWGNWSPSYKVSVSQAPQQTVTAPKEERLKVFPTLAGGPLVMEVTLNRKEVVKAELLSLDGKLVSKPFRKKVAAGRQLVQIKRKRIKAGLYLLVVKIGEEQLTQRVMLP
nr:family 10 glycosylhydrolase [Rufibacter quisquiliarum]